ncbi:TPA: hypothetical protein HA244_04795 [Candidatus Micrarchaeota archaeon]|nr:hypothetical protein [Candidatus Micrarchaeota archaeon]
MKKGQAAIEYILLVALGLFIIVVGFTLAFYINNFTNSILGGVEQTRSQTIALLVR